MILPKSVLDAIDRNSGSPEIASEIKREVSNIKDSLPMALTIAPAIESGRTHGDWNLNFNGNELRPDSTLTWPIIDAMEKSALPSFAVLMKLAPILSVFRSWNGILVKSTDTELSEVVSENMRQVLPLMAMEFGFRSMVDGVCFMETRYENLTKFELGVADNRLPSKLFTVAKTPNVVDPRTVSEIRRTNSGRKFDGFVQSDPLPPHQDIVVKAEQSLVIPNSERFRSLWGKSVFEQMYEPWFWLQVFLRATVRWGERMSSPTVVGRAPMFETITDPNDSTRSIKTLDWMASIASSLSRSSYATIPSDTNPETGKPNYEVGYISAGDSGVSSALVSILQELTQMVIRAAISADRSTTQSSGGVGSYAIGSIHDRATQYHNQMILVSWVSYLNRYFLPWLSYHNRGLNGPPIRLEVASIDPSFRDLLTQLLGTMGNSKPGQDALWLLDYETLLSLAHVPTLDPEEAKANRERYEKEAMDRAEEAMRRQQKMAPPPEAAQARRDQAAKDREDNASTMKKVEATTDAMVDAINSGKPLPIIIGADQLADIIKEVRSPIVLQEPSGDWDESRVKRDPGGKFASKSSSGSEEGSEGPQFIGDKENAKKLLREYGLTEEEIAEAILIIDSAKTYGSVDEAAADITNFLVENGFGEKADIERASAVVLEDMSRGIGYYNYAGDKSIGIEQGLKQAILTGNPMGVNALMHEILHASSEDFDRGSFTPENDFQKEALAAGYPTRATTIEELSQAVPLIEGRNEMANIIAMNKFYGTEGKTLNDPAYRAAIHSMYGDVSHYNTSSDIQPYSNDIDIFSQVALVAQKKSGVDPSSWITESNKMGLNTVAAEDELRILFPDRMKEYGSQNDGTWRFPTTAEISKWATEDYDIGKDGARGRVLASGDGNS